LESLQTKTTDSPRILFSIIMFLQENNIESQSLNSIFAQTLTSWELILVVPPSGNKMFSEFMMDNRVEQSMTEVEFSDLPEILESKNSDYISFIYQGTIWDPNYLAHAYFNLTSFSVIATFSPPLLTSTNIMREAWVPRYPIKPNRLLDSGLEFIKMVAGEDGDNLFLDCISVSRKELIAVFDHKKLSFRPAIFEIFKKGKIFYSDKCFVKLSNFSIADHRPSWEFDQNYFVTPIQVPSDADPLFHSEVSVVDFDISLCDSQQRVYPISPSLIRAVHSSEVVYLEIKNLINLIYLNYEYHTDSDLVTPPDDQDLQNPLLTSSSRDLTNFIGRHRFDILGNVGFIVHSSQVQYLKNESRNGILLIEKDLKLEFSIKEYDSERIRPGNFDCLISIDIPATMRDFCVIAQTCGTLLRSGGIALLAVCTQGIPIIENKSCDESPILQLEDIYRAIEKLQFRGEKTIVTILNYPRVINQTNFGENISDTGKALIPIGVYTIRAERI
jgi:hypothetical protein